MSTSSRPDNIISTSGPASAADLAKVNAALEETKGDRVMAGKLLGVTRDRISNLVDGNPSLRTRWRDPRESAESPALMPEQIAARTTPEAISLSPDQKMASALAVSERKMNRSLAKLGFGRQEIEAISSIEEFAGQHFDATLSIMHGGMLKGAMRLMLLSDHVEKAYLQRDDLDEKDRRWWWDVYFRILESLRMMNEQSNKAALTKAMIEMKRKEGTGLGKPGFTPVTAIQINATNASVTATDTNARPKMPPPAQ